MPPPIDPDRPIYQAVRSPAVFELGPHGGQPRKRRTMRILGSRLHVLTREKRGGLQINTIPSEFTLMLLIEVALRKVCGFMGAEMALPPIRK